VSEVARLLARVREEPALAGCLRHCETLPEQPARLAGLPPALAPLAPLLAGRALYSHQARALARLAEGEDVVLATPTASGKTLVYNLAALAHLRADPAAHALYLFPLKALEQDQCARFAADSARLGPAPGPRAAIYDGDTPPARRRRLRDEPPALLVTNPDMLHLGILPHHGAWRRFFAGLRLVVLDELHAYRGVFGSHVAQLLRRLLRVAAFHGGRPQLVAASATVANPGELAERLCGRPFRVVRESGAPRPPRHVLLLRPDASPYTLAARLFRLSVGLGLRTIAFTKARRITELMHTWIAEAAPELCGRISSYRAGFLPGERREIEARLFSGELLGVISTSALEMGIDVGELDVCILVGYPGSQIATWQRGGRVGRAREGLIALVAQPDALDQYLVSHPRALFERGFEHAVVDPANPEVAGAHLPCAAAELPLREGEEWLRDPAARERVAALEDEGELLRSEGGGEWFAARRQPQRRVSLRSAGETWRIVAEPAPGGRAELVGTVGSARVLSECHGGAIYLHRARQYLVEHLDLAGHEARVRAVRAAHYTQALSEKETEILERRRERAAGTLRVVEGRVRVTTRVVGFERRRLHGQELLSTEPLELPPRSFETGAIWLDVPDAVRWALEADGLHPMGGLHACEHAALSLFPLFALCDRHDVAGISSVRHPQTGGAAIFFYDAHPGGVGLAASLFERVETLLEATLELVGDCPCESGCPGCVHSPRCGSGNRPIDKAAARRTLAWCLGREPLPIPASVPPPPRPAPAPRPTPPPAATPRVLFFDLETQRGAEEVGGWHNAHLMRLAVAVAWDRATGRFESWSEAGVGELLARLRAAELVVGFNVRCFDYRVLRGYTDLDLDRLPTFDLLEAVRARLGFRVSLGHLAEETLGSRKDGDGLASLRWWREGRVDRVRAYCERDVALLRDLFEHALARGYLLFRTRRGDRLRIPARFTLAELVEAARAAAAEPRAAARARAPGRAASVQAGAGPHPAVEELEVEPHDHMADLAR
jgi:DEAD/DEAH box helicase domain-containing protein